MDGEGESLQIVSHFPGRLRVRARRFREQPELAGAVARRLGREPGVRSASASAVTGSLLILYAPREVRVEALITAVLSEGGLASVAADAQEHADGTALVAHIKRVALGADTRLFRAASGKVDLRVAVPGALVLGSAATLLFRFRSSAPPQWYDLLFWSYVTFNNLNLLRQRVSPDAR